MVAGPRVQVLATQGPTTAAVAAVQALQAQGTTVVTVLLNDASVVDDELILELVEFEMRELVGNHGMAVVAVLRR